jgi:hypothetical protein
VRYVNVQRRRREGRSRGEQIFASLWSNVEHNPYLSTTLGTVIGVLASLVLFFVVGPFLMSPPPPSLLITLIVTSLVLSFCVALSGARLLRRWRPRSTSPKPGGEKQLLMVIRDSGGSITPVEAALGTSLTVDEAEEMLSRLANRGHLLVESRDGALYYALPGRRSAGLEGWIT